MPINNLPTSFSFSVIIEIVPIIINILPIGISPGITWVEIIPITVNSLPSSTCLTINVKVIPSSSRRLKPACGYPSINRIKIVPIIV